MQRQKRYKLNISGSSVTRNTVYNLLGYGIPMFVALAIIPSLVTGLGTERFGLLNLVWMVIGYFSFFDFGISRSLTKITAEKIGKDEHEQIPGLFWTSLILMLGTSVLFGLILWFFVPDILNLINLSEELKPESLNTLYLLVISIPIVSTTAGLRGVLEAYQKFGIINIMRVSLGILTFLVPFIILFITNSLFWIVLCLILIRVIVWIIYLKLCLIVNEDIRKNPIFKVSLIKPVLHFSFWITIANVVGPIITNIDRFFISIIVSATAVAFYATPYEIVTKLLLIPTALVAVLFPVFSASFFNDPEISEKYLYRSVKYIFIILYPIVFLIVTFSFQGMQIWLGNEFAEQSSFILQLLAIGILFNGLAQIPFNFLQGIGKPKIPAILNLLELPIYLIGMWMSIKLWGIKGAVIIWLIRIVIDTMILFIITLRSFNLKYDIRLFFPQFILPLVCLVAPFFILLLLVKIIYAIVVLSIFIVVVWRKFISIEEQNYLLTKIGFR